MREQIRTSGLRELIVEVNNEIVPTVKEIQKATDKNVQKSLKRFLFSMLLEKTIAHYSVGDDKQTVTQALLQTIPAFQEAFEYKDIGQNYEDALWLVSLGVLCNISLPDFEKITSILKRDNVNDVLFTTIVQYKNSNWQNNASAPLWHKPYSRILQVQNAAQLKEYLDKYWYQENEESYWHNMHKNTKVNNYFGYWSWEAAAIAKIKNIDDSSLKNQLYYPYDAVHW